ncbi:hypothetical protein ACHAWC_006428 [Mediolabrus comicus]
MMWRPISITIVAVATTTTYVSGWTAIEPDALNRREALSRAGGLLYGGITTSTLSVPKIANADDDETTFTSLLSDYKPLAYKTLPNEGRSVFPPPFLPPINDRATYRYSLGRDTWALEQLIAFANVTATIRTNVVKLSNGRLWVCGPLWPTDEYCKLLDELGLVSDVVLPVNALEHKAPMKQFLAKYPEAKVWVAPATHSSKEHHGTMAKSTKASSKGKKKSTTNLVLAKEGTAFSIPIAVTSRKVILEDRLPVGAIGRVFVDPTSSLWSYENMRTAAEGLAAAVNGNKANSTIFTKVKIIADISWEIGYHKIGQQIADLSTLDSNVLQNKLLNIIHDLKVTHGMENVSRHLVTELSSFGDGAELETAYTNYHSAKGSSKGRRKKELLIKCAKALNRLAKVALPGGSLEEQRLLELFQSNANAYETRRDAQNAAQNARKRESRSTQNATIATLRKDAEQLRENGNEEEAAKKDKLANELYDKSKAGKENARQKRRKSTQKAEVSALRNDAEQLRENGNEEEAVKKDKLANELYDKSLNGKDNARQKTLRSTQNATIATLRNDAEHCFASSPIFFENRTSVLVCAPISMNVSTGSFLLDGRVVDEKYASSKLPNLYKFKNFMNSGLFIV